MSSQESITLSLEAAHSLVVAALTAAGVSRANGTIVAAALVAGERDGLASHGLSRVAAYCAQARAGKIDGHAKPAIARDEPGAITIDAGFGFAYPAIELALAPCAARARAQGSCALAIAHSHHAGVLGRHVERFAEYGLVALAFANAPAAIAPWGGTTGLYGTNPIAFAAPRIGHAPLVIDMSVSGVARGHVMLAQQRGEPIPDDWALDSRGNPTTDAAAAMAGTMRPMGGAKGAALALVVEIMAAVLTGASLSSDASSLFDADNGPPDLGQSFLLIDPARLGGPAFGQRLETLLTRVTDQPGARLPGDRRLVARAQALEHGIQISPELFGIIQALAST